MTNPTKLGKYELDPIPIGQGAMGIVYKAFDPDLRQSVAIKVIRTQILEGPGEDNARLRFKNEAVAGRRLRHPNVVPVYDYSEEQDCSYIVMAFVEGRRLKDALDGDHRFSVPEAVSIMDQLLDALDYAHRKNVVHRDIKPANILYGKDGRIQVADFGIAKVDASTLTRTGTVLGTPGYMAPEQCQGTPADQRADLFAAGVILYELLTGEQPFRGSTGIATMQQVLSLQPVRPSQLNVQVPLVLDEIVAKAIAKRREERFPSAREFASALHLFPLTASEREPQQPSKDFALGQGDGKGARQWEVSPPFGREMLVAIAAQEPLFSTTRPEMDTSKEYLLALSRALEHARSKGSIVLADLVPITTTPATQQYEAAGPSQP